MKAATYNTEQVGNRLRSGMADKGIDAETMSKMTGLSVFSIRAWMRGDSAMTLDSAVKLCDALQWPLDRLVRREQP